MIKLSSYNDDRISSLAQRELCMLLCRQDAERAVLSFTSTPAELLRRRKLKRDILFRYLYNEGVAISPNADKYLIIQTILRHWGSADVPLSYLMVSSLIVKCLNCTISPNFSFFTLIHVFKYILLIF